MKHFAIAITFLCLAVTQAQAAGIREMQIPADARGPSITAMLWTPCAVPARNINIDRPLTVPGVKDCPIMGNKLPLVVISHGFGGSLLGHHDTAEVLADGGFIVVALNHPRDFGPNATFLSGMDVSSMTERPVDVQRVLDYVLRSSPAGTSIDMRRIGFFGFSRGGFTGLLLAGAIPDYPLSAKIAQFFSEPSSAYDPRFKAFVIADPVSFFPDKNSLRKITAPVQLWASQTGGQGVTPEKVATVANNLSVRPEFQVVPNSTHLSFLAPCSPALAKLATADVCTDPPGFDRAAFHKQFDTQILAFFKRSLGT